MPRRVAKTANGHLTTGRTKMPRTTVATMLKSTVGAKKKDHPREKASAVGSRQLEGGPQHHRKVSLIMWVTSRRRKSRVAAWFFVLLASMAAWIGADAECPCPGPSQRLQLVRLYRRERAQGFEQGHRHQGQLHDLRSNEILEAKLRAGRSGYDVVVPRPRRSSCASSPPACIQPLDKAKLKNLEQSRSRDHGALAKYDPGNAHAIPWMWGTTGIGYNVADDQEAHARRAGRFAEDDVRSRRRRQVQGLRRHDARQRRPTSSRRR